MRQKKLVTGIQLDKWRDSRHPTEGVILKYYSEPPESLRAVLAQGEGPERHDEFDQFDEEF